MGWGVAEAMHSAPQSPTAQVIVALGPMEQLAQELVDEPGWHGRAWLAPRTLSRAFIVFLHIPQ